MIKFGLGIENEVTFALSDSKRVKRDMNISSGSDKLSPNVTYRGRSAFWNKTRGWSRNSGASDVFLASGDPTVDGNVNSSGFEFQTTVSHSVGVKPKDMVNSLSRALNDGALELKGQRISLNTIKPNPFGASTGFSNPKRFGSYHINITMPYHENSNQEYINTYYDKLFKGIKVVRAIEPLFFAMVGGADFKSVGNPQWAEGSGRQAYNSYANLGNVKLDSEFKRAFGRSSTYFKHGNNPPSFRDKMELTVGTERGISDTDVGDVVVKNYSNVDSKIPTIEFRFLDPFYVPNLYDVLKVLISALEHGSNVGDINDARSSPSWNDATARIIEEGWNARLPKAYMVMLKEKLNLNIKTTDGMRADILFNEIAKELWKANKSGFWVKTMFDETSQPKVLNLNKNNWEAQLRHKYTNEPRFEKYLDKVITSMTKIDSSKSDGWIKVNFDESGKIVIRDLIFDDESFGVDMATEDFEDLLFTLERIGTIKLKNTSTGQISELKMLITNPKEIMKKLDNMSDLENVEEQVISEVEPEDSVDEDEVSSHVDIPESLSGDSEDDEDDSPTMSGTIRLRANEDTQINLRNLSIVKFDAQSESDIDYNLRDLSEVFDIASFIDEAGNRFYVRVYSAKIKYNMATLMSFWAKSRNSIKLFVDKDLLGSDRTISDIINEISSSFYSVRSVTDVNTFVRQLTYDEFFNRLKTVAREHYDKSYASNIIQLDRAGIDSLKAVGLKIISLSRGKKYFIGDKKKFTKLKSRFGDKISTINYVPYQKKITVRKEGNNYALLSNGVQIDRIIKVVEELK